MWSARVLGWAMALLASAATAAPGDALLVTGNVVNVRAGPGLDNPVLFQTRRDQQVMELTRTDDWIRVRVSDRAAEGWIHQSLLQVVEPTGPVDPVVGSQTPGSLGETQQSALERPSVPVESAFETAPPSERQALALFRSSVDELNARAMAVAGVELFAGAEPAGNGAVRVMVTEMWDLVPDSGQASYVNTLFNQWYAARGGAGPMRVQVVDPSGTVVSEKSGRTP